MKHLSTRNRRFGAISTEYVIILVLIAVAGILAFMLLGGQLRSQVQTSVDKVSGSTVTTTKVKQAVTDKLTSDKPDMTGSETGAAEAEVTLQ
jgi:Flp pilus assembly pilin Flp